MSQVKSPEGPLALPVLSSGEGCCSAPPERWTSLEERRTGVAGWSGEFPPGADQPPDGPSRRDFLRLAGAAAALTGLGACFKSPAERILPFRSQPVELTPGNALHYATAWVVDGVATGLLVTCREGRPIKVEGNPDHPASLGGTGPMEQASVHHLYDRDRARLFRRGPDPTDAPAVLTWLRGRAKALQARQGEGLAFLLEPSASPTRARLLDELRAAFPRARVLAYAPAASTASAEGTALAFGRPLDQVHHLERIRTLVSVGADVLSPGPRTLRGIRDFAQTREPGPEMSRLYVAEGHLTVTGMISDHRLRLPPSRMPALLLAVAQELSARSGASELSGLEAPAGLSDHERRFARAAAGDLWQQRGRSLLVAGDALPPPLHALAHACNQALGAIGATATFHEPQISPPPCTMAELKALADAMRAGQVETLVVTAYDPAFTAPADLAFAQAMGQVRERIYLGYHEDETALRSTHFAPLAHPFEAWGDACAADGTASIVQPLIAPLFGGLSEIEFLAPFTSAETANGHDLVKATWTARTAGPGFQDHWEDWLVQGLIPGSAAEPVQPRLASGIAARAARAVQASTPSLELELVADPRVHDGRFASVPWLQELGDPITKITWDNAVLVSPRTAARLGLSSGDVTELRTAAGALEVPAWVSP
jgi:hypothetical protein